MASLRITVWPTLFIRSDQDLKNVIFLAESIAELERPLSSDEEDILEDIEVSVEVRTSK